MLHAPVLPIKEQLVLAPLVVQLPAVAGSNLTPFRANPTPPGPRVAAALATTGTNTMLVFTFWAAMVLGLLAFGKVPTSWSGKPLPTTVRRVLLHDQLTVLVALTELLLLKAL